MVEVEVQLQIENTNVCQAKCVFCTYPSMQRPKGSQSLALTRKILDEAATIPEIEMVTFTGLGEPLLDPKLLERIAYARKMLPKLPITLFSNGALLTPKLFDNLVDAGLSTLYVSLNGVRPEQRSQVMGLDDFEKVTKALDYARETSNGRCGVIVKGISSKDLMECGDADKFRARWGGFTAEGGSAFLHLEGNWAGKMFPMRVLPTEPCSRALSQIMVLWDGRVALCCFDGEGEVILGDLNTQSIREAYNSEKYVAIRQAHHEGRRQSVPICARCTGI